jgi:hypothetical protein
MQETGFTTHLSYVDETTLAANEEKYLYVKDDPVWGLRVPGDSGYVQNDGPGVIVLRNSDDGEKYTKEITINPGDKATFENDDDEHVHTLHLKADSSGAAYRSRFARSRW